MISTRDFRQRHAAERATPLSRHSSSPHPHQTGHAALPVVLATGFLAIALGVVGPALDGEPSGTTSDARDERGEIAVFANQAAATCEQAAGDGATLKHIAPGEIACGDQDGRKPVHVVYALRRVR